MYNLILGPISQNGTEIEPKLNRNGNFGGCAGGVSVGGRRLERLQKYMYAEEVANYWAGQVDWRHAAAQPTPTRTASARPHARQDSSYRVTFLSAPLPNIGIFTGSPTHTAIKSS